MLRFLIKTFTKLQSERLKHCQTLSFFSKTLFPLLPSFALQSITLYLFVTFFETTVPPKEAQRNENKLYAWLHSDSQSAAWVMSVIRSGCRIHCVLLARRLIVRWRRLGRKWGTERQTPFMKVSRGTDCMCWKMRAAKTYSISIYSLSLKTQEAGGKLHCQNGIGWIGLPIATIRRDVHRYFFNWFKLVRQGLLNAKCYVSLRNQEGSMDLMYLSVLSAEFISPSYRLLKIDWGWITITHEFTVIFSIKLSKNTYYEVTDFFFSEFAAEECRKV